MLAMMLSGSVLVFLAGPAVQWEDLRQRFVSARSQPTRGRGNVLLAVVTANKAQAFSCAAKFDH